VEPRPRYDLPMFVIPSATHSTAGALRFGLLLAVCGVCSATLSAADPYFLKPAEIISLAASSKAAIAAPVRTVVDREYDSPASDPHDYVSYARYYWPDPSKPGGLPYLRQDGRHNRAQVAKGDHERLGAFCSTVEKLAAAWRVNNDEVAARRAGEWLRGWFITPATRMNPNLDYAQVRLGHDGNRGSPSGVLDARGFAQVIDALFLLDDSPACTTSERQAIRGWFTDYLRWLTTAPIAKAEHAAKNNHGSWFLVQAVPIALFVGRADLARQLCEENKARIGFQVRPDGSQPEEIRRVDGLGYSVFNLEAQLRLARIASALGIDLWNYTAPSGASLRRAVAYLTPFNLTPAQWPHAQKAVLKPGFVDKIIAEVKSHPGPDHPISLP
jgi:hypothetical protein